VQVRKLKGTRAYAAQTSNSEHFDLGLHCNQRRPVRVKHDAYGQNRGGLLVAVSPAEVGPYIIIRRLKGGATHSR